VVATRITRLGGVERRESVYGPISACVTMPTYILTGGW
jgi:hypothetical protein